VAQVFDQKTIRLRKRERRRKEPNAIYRGHLHLCWQPRAGHALRSDQNVRTITYKLEMYDLQGPLMLKALDISGAPKGNGRSILFALKVL
jgi:hypothetical protein